MLSFSLKKSPFYLCLRYNRVFLLSKPNFGSINDQVFRYLYDNPNKIITKKELETNVTKEPISKSLHMIIKELGFKKDLREAFFNISKTNIKFINPVPKKVLEDLGIKNIKISID